jgi:hypothetical protein
VGEVEPLEVLGRAEMGVGPPEVGRLAVRAWVVLLVEQVVAWVVGP